MKLLSVTVPCYNSQDYMRHCVETLLPGGDEVEILIVDDGSKDDTAAIADQLQAQYPTIVRAIHQENAGHGGAVMKGLENATGLYFKVVDSDDWVDTQVLKDLLGLAAAVCPAGGGGGHGGQRLCLRQGGGPPQKGDALSLRHPPEQSPPLGGGGQLPQGPLPADALCHLPHPAAAGKRPGFAPPHLLRGQPLCLRAAWPR